jgi:hypothetical protein
MQRIHKHVAALAAAVFAATAFTAAPAQAGTVRMSYDGVDGIKVKVKRDKPGGGTHNKTVWAGEMLWNVDSSGSTGFGQSFGSQLRAFCIELTQTAHANMDTYTITDTALAPTPGSANSGGSDGMGDAKAADLEKLWGAYRDDADSTIAKAAFQLSVWEIVYDDGLDLGDGSFQVLNRNGNDDDLAKAQAQTWLDSLAGYTGPSVSLAALSHGQHQDQLIAVPTPSAAMGGLFALGSLLACRRRQ